jgi:polar amino acid transport system substrate-binding protein
MRPLFFRRFISITQRLSACLLLCATLMPAHAAEKIVRLASLDWPPYVGARLPDQGLSAKAVKDAYRAMGYTVEIVFLPWARTVHVTKTDPRIDGFFPEYASKERAADFHYSRPIGSGPLGFVERVESPVTWSTLDDVAKQKIAVVRDYVNTDEFDKRVAKGQLNVSVNNNDTDALREVGAGLVSLAVIDRHVFDHLMNTSPELAHLRGRLRFNDHVLEDKQLYICFKKGARGETLARVLHDGMKRTEQSPSRQR